MVVNGRTTCGQILGERRKEVELGDLLLKVGELSVPVSLQSIAKCHYNDRGRTKKKSQKRRKKRADDANILLEAEK